MSEQSTLWQKISEKMTNKDLKSDVTWLAKSWERVVSRIDCPSSIIALIIFYELVGAYCRGCEIRIRGHAGEVSIIATLLILRVAGEEYPDLWFPSLTRLGLNTEEGFTEAIKRWKDA